MGNDVAFLALSAVCATLALGLALAGPGGLSAGLASALFGVATGGLILTAIYETDLPGAPFTSEADIHEMTFLVNTLGIIGGALLLCLAFGRAPAWRPFQRAGSLLFAVVIAAAVGQVLTLRKGAPYGDANRVFATAMVAWLLATAMQLRRVTASSHPRDHDS